MSQKIRMLVGLFSTHCKIVLENLIQWLFMSGKQELVISVINNYEPYFPFILSNGE